MIPGHVCTAYCRGDVHAELVYAEAGAAPEQIADSFQSAYDGIEVVTVEPATEAPGFAELDAMGLPYAIEHLSFRGTEPADASRFVVSWRDRVTNGPQWPRPGLFVDYRVQEDEGPGTPTGG